MKFWSDQIVEFDEVYHRTKLEVGTSFPLEGDAKRKIVDGRTDGGTYGGTEGGTEGGRDGWTKFNSMMPSKMA